jgi:hypothetical protein
MMFFNPKKKKKKEELEEEKEELKEELEEKEEDDEEFPTRAEIYRTTTCPKTKKIKVVLTTKIIPPAINLMKKFPHTEWIMLLLGEYDDKKFTYRITDYYIPEQTVTGTSATITQNKYPFDPDLIVGSLHSHHGMHIGASSVDERMSYPVLLIIRERSTRTSEEKTFPIGEYEIVPYVSMSLYYCLKEYAFIMFQPELELESTEVISKEELDRIKQERIIYTPQTPYSPYYQYWKKQQEKEKEEKKKEDYKFWWE